MAGLTPEEMKILEEAKGKRKWFKKKDEKPEIVTGNKHEVAESGNKLNLFEGVAKANETPKEKAPKQRTEELLEEAHQAAIVHKVQHDEKIQKQVLQGAEEHVLTELEIRKQEQTKKVQDATFDAIKDAAQNYGIDSGRPMWQLRMAKAGSAFWFVIWFVISSVTFTPIMFFLKMIGTQIKHAGLKWFFTVILYLLLAFAVFVWISKITGWVWWERT